MADESFFYKVKVTISEAALKGELARVEVEFVAALSGNTTSDTKPLQALHRELLYALVGAEHENNAKLRTAYWYVKLGCDYYYFTDVVLCALGTGFKAMLPAAYLPDKDGAATNPYLYGLAKIGMNYEWAPEAGRILQDLTLTKNVSGWTLIADASLSRHVLGEFAGVLPCPGPWSWSKDGEWHKEKRPLSARGHRLVVGAWTAAAGNVIRPSESIRESLAALTSMLQPTKSHVTLIMGEPGAGKEVFSDAMHFGSVMGWDKAWKTHASEERDSETIIIVKDGKEARSIAGITLEEFNERLFTVESSRSTIYTRLTRWWRKNAAEPQQECLVQKAEEGGTIFLDEFDKPAQSREIYSALLRVLEAEEYIRRTVHGDRIVTSPATYKDVSWVMAGAFFQVDPRESIPRDLWSRMTGLLNLKNPVAGDCDYGATLFMYAYLRQVGATLAAVRSKPEEGITKLLEAVSKFSTGITFRESVALRILGIALPDQAEAAGKVFRPQAGLRTLANDFAKHLRFLTKFVGDATDTPRGIMKAADAAFRVVRDCCIANPALWLGDNTPDGSKAAESARDAAHNALVLSRGPS